MLAQGTGTLAVFGSMLPEHKIPEITGTVLKHMKTLLRHHIVHASLGEIQGLYNQPAYLK